MPAPRVVPAKLNYGGFYQDPATELYLVAYHPTLFPTKWRLYVDSLHESYKSYGVSSACSAELLGDTPDTSLFFLAEDEQGNVFGGIRFVGPLSELTHSATLQEMAASPQILELREAMSSHLNSGLIEIKGLWAKGSATTGASLAACLVRTTRPALALLGAGHAYASYADRLTPMVASCGAANFYSTPVPYPDERYDTVAVHFDAASIVPNAALDDAFAYSAQDNVFSPPQDLLDTISRPLILDVANPLFALPNATRLIDHLAPQRAQLEEISDLPDSLKSEPARLIYYPWSGLVVKTLGPRSFAAARLERNRNKITRSEQARLRSRRVAIVGASAGHAIAYTLAQEGLAGTLRLSDFDTVELSNLNRIPATLADLGLNKSVVLARRIAELDPYLKVEIFPGVTEDSVDDFLHDIDVVIEECDSLDVKVLVREHARALGIPVLMETSDRGTLDVERFDQEPSRPLFHGRLGDTTASELGGLSLKDRGPHVIRIMGTDTMSPRALASLLEVDRTLGGWPQLSGDIALGAATMAAALRRLGSLDDLPSGRIQIDLDAHLDRLAPAPYDSSLLDALASPFPTDPPDLALSPRLQVADAARRAPSGGNTQPWNFAFQGDDLLISIDPSASANAMDIQSRGTFVAAGAALFNARVRASALGILGPVTTFPAGLLAKNVARLSLGSGYDQSLSDLDPFIATRHTNRRHPDTIPRTLDPGLRALLEAAAGAEGVSVRLVTDAALDDLARQISTADQLRFLLPLVHASMMEELRWPGRDDLTTGLDVRTLEMDLPTLSSLSVLARPDVMDELRSWKAGSALAANTYRAISTSSALCVLSVPRDGPRGYLRGGQGLERLWLTATKLGLSVQPVAPVFLCADSEADLATLGGPRYQDDLSERQSHLKSTLDLDDTEVLIMVLRLFYGPPATTTSIRRPLDELMSVVTS